ncbi:MAG: hypothetical protein H6860_05865 [Rhodospirillales bacterium]|nr:hypothetical protein [Alphaproteobacteria bacterium]MCB9981906.1 hypothetical protein [Rhodospirillales bacterium]
MTQQKPIIGCLALQGAVELHRPHVEACGATFKAVKTPAQFEEVDGFILPGGESTTMLKLIERFDLWDVLAKQFAKKPVWGICAGSILMAETVLVSLPSSSRWRASSEALAPPLSRGQALGSGKDEPQSGSHMDPRRLSVPSERRGDDRPVLQKSFGLLPITVQRNGYGRQIDSHHALIDGYEVSLIRAPVITAVDDSVEVLARHEDTPIWVKRGAYMASTFHPELTQDFPSPMHKAFIEIVRSSVQSAS